MLRAIKRCKLDASRLHLDLTAVRFAGSYEASTLVKKGWSAERTIKRQVKTLQASTRSGVPVYFRPHQGAESELPAFMEAVETLAGSLPPGLVVVAGSGLGYLEDLCSLDSAKVGFVVPLRADTGWAERFVKDVPGGLGELKRLAYCSQREQCLPKKGCTAWKGLLRPFPVTDGHGEHHGLHVVYVWSSEEEASVKDARERELQKAEAALARVRNGLGGRYYKTKKQVDNRVAVVLSENVAGLIKVETGEADGKPTISWSRNDEAVAAAGALDGFYALATNLLARDHRRLSALEVLQIYKDQWVVEQRHRDLKQTLRVRPVLLHNDARIEALVAVVGIALLIFGLIEAELRAALGDEELLPGILPEGRAAKPTARAALTVFEGLEVSYGANGLVLDHLSQVQRLILALLDIPLPWPERAED